MSKGFTVCGIVPVDGVWIWAHPVGCNPKLLITSLSIDVLALLDFSESWRAGIAPAENARLFTAH
jgi:hypothetical protein